METGEDQCDTDKIIDPINRLYLQQFSKPVLNLYQFKFNFAQS